MPKGDILDSKNKPTWCPGCGNFALWLALKEAVVELGIARHEVLFVHGIGCSGNMANMLGGYGWHSLHGRAVPTAEAAKLVNKKLTVIVTGGDGDGYGEGLNHLIHGIRANIDITYIVHDNQIYGLTTGQTSPTSEKGTPSKSNPLGVIDSTLNPMAIALAAGGTFVARGFSGNSDQLKELFKKAILHRGFSLVDVFQPCVTFNHVNTYKYFFDRVYDLQKENHPVTDHAAAWQRAWEWGKRVPTGIFYQNDARKSYADELPQAQITNFVARDLKPRNIKPLLKKFI